MNPQNENTANQSHPHYLGEHRFDVGVAIQIGIDKAILLKNIFYWTEFNKIRNTNCHDGQYWTYNTAKAFGDIFPYMNAKTIARQLKQLQKEGWLLIGNYNQTTFDRTQWYSANLERYKDAQLGIVWSDDKVQSYLNMEPPTQESATTTTVQKAPKTAISQNENCISQNEKSKSQNKKSISQNESTIPYSKPYSKPNEKLSLKIKSKPKKEASLFDEPTPTSKATFEQLRAENAEKRKVAQKEKIKSQMQANCIDEHIQPSVQEWMYERWERGDRLTEGASRKAMTIFQNTYMEICQATTATVAQGIIQQVIDNAIGNGWNSITRQTIMDTYRKSQNKRAYGSRLKVTTRNKKTEKTVNKIINPSIYDKYEQQAKANG